MPKIEPHKLVKDKALPEKKAHRSLEFSRRKPQGGFQTVRKKS